jgi:hypothetical protein
MVCPYVVTGTKATTGSAGSAPTKSRGATPTMVVFTAPICSCCPIASLRPPNRVCHSAYPITETGEPRGGTSSVLSKKRPRAGRASNIPKYDALTIETFISRALSPEPTAMRESWKMALCPTDDAERIISR